MGKNYTRFLRFRRDGEEISDWCVEAIRVIEMLEGRLAKAEADLVAARAKIPPAPSPEAAARGRANRWATKTAEERRAHGAMMLRHRWPGRPA